MWGSLTGYNRPRGELQKGEGECPGPCKRREAELRAGSVPGFSPCRRALEEGMGVAGTEEAMSW